MELRRKGEIVCLSILTFCSSSSSGWHIAILYVNVLLLCRFLLLFGLVVGRCFFGLRVVLGLFLF